MSSCFHVLALALQDERLDQLLRGQLNPCFSKVAAHCNQASKCLEAPVPGVPPTCRLFTGVGGSEDNDFEKLPEWLQFASELDSCHQWLWTNPERCALGLAPTRTDLANWLLTLLSFARTWYLNLRKLKKQNKNQKNQKLISHCSEGHAVQQQGSGKFRVRRVWWSASNVAPSYCDLPGRAVLCVHYVRPERKQSHLVQAYKVSPPCPWGWLYLSDFTSPRFHLLMPMNRLQGRNFGGRVQPGAARGCLGRTQQSLQGTGRHVN